jgi:hypothetical protein
MNRLSRINGARRRLNRAASRIHDLRTALDRLLRSTEGSDLPPNHPALSEAREALAREDRAVRYEIALAESGLSESRAPAFTAPIARRPAIGAPAQASGARAAQRTRAQKQGAA